MIKSTRKVKSTAVKSPTLAAAEPTKVKVVATTPEPASRLGHVSFELVKPGAKQVCVAGSFNGWKPERSPLISLGDGRFVGDVTVDPGRYEYLFVVDGQWLPDPKAKETVQNPFGGTNSVLTVSA
jgi:1,4-alpha-glucan branching enzyme